jgi:hypothetical protein
LFINFHLQELQFSKDKRQCSVNGAKLFATVSLTVRAWRREELANSIGQSFIDCQDRGVIGYAFALRSRAKEAERSVEAACLARFGTLRPVGAPVLRSGNGLIFQYRRFGKPVETLGCSRTSSRRIRGPELEH